MGEWGGLNFNVLTYLAQLDFLYFLLMEATYQTQFWQKKYLLKDLIQLLVLSIIYAIRHPLKIQDFCIVQPAVFLILLSIHKR